MTDEKIRVHELAKKHNLSSKAMQTLLQELGVMAKSHMTVLSDEEVALVANHFEASSQESRKSAEKSHRFAVEKAKPKVARLSAREKVAQDREQAERTPAEETPAPEPAAAPVRVIRRMQAPPPPPPPAAPAPAHSAPAQPETVAEPRRTPPPSAGGFAAPGAARPGQPGSAGTASPQASTPAPAPAPPPRPMRPVPRMDMNAAVTAAAETRRRLESEARQQPVMAPPTPGRGSAARTGKGPAPARAPQPPPRGRGGRPGRGEGAGPEAPERQARGEINPTEIRRSVLETLAKIEVPRRPIAEPSLPAPRKKSSRKVREEKKERVARQMEQEEEQKRAAETLVRITEYVTVQELAEKLGVKPVELIAKLMGMGNLVTINQRLEKETIELVVAEFGSQIEWLTTYGEDILAEPEHDETAATPRNPVVTVMGHVDHGKTTLLDTIRKTNVVAQEAGGITQHIGAYQVSTPKGPITFLDTPGHEAFTAMRARGAQVTDIVVVVVAADDKVMPQTVEALDHAKASKCPIIIAINKIDLPGANIMQVKQQLMQHNVLVEEFGGEVQCVEISAKKGVGIDKLLDAIAVQAEVMELKAISEGHARGTVIESKKDPGRGVSFTVLIRRGTLRVGETFVVGRTEGRVRVLRDEFDKKVRQAIPGQPVVVFGAADVPTAGDELVVLESEREAKEIAGSRQRLQREQTLHAPKRKVALTDLLERIEGGELKSLNLIVKGDVAGSVEALCGSFMNLASPKVGVNIVHSGVGAINENDIMLAATSDAIIIGFHLHPAPPIMERARREGVSIELYSIIYEAVEDVKKAMEGLLEPVKKESTTGAAEVRQLFKVPRLGTIAGSYVTDGAIKRGSKVRIIRDQVLVYEGTVTSLRRFKDDAREVQTGFECGIGVEGFNDLKVGDVFQTYEIEEIRQRL